MPGRVCVFVLELATGCMSADRSVSEQPHCTSGVLAALEFRADRACLAIAPQTAGTPYDCSISDVQHYGASNASEQVIDRCDGTATGVPCWQIVTDPQSCGANQAVNIERGGISAPDDNHVVGYCLWCLF